MTAPSGLPPIGRSADADPFWSLRVDPFRLLLWAGAQCAALLLAGSDRVPIAWQPAERQAVAMWVISQWIVLALFFPALLVNTGTAGAMLLLIWPYGLLASVLAGSGRGVIAVCADQSLLVITLACCAWQCRSAVMSRVAGTVFRVWVLGGVLMAYLAADQFPPAASTGVILRIDPLLATLQVLDGKIPLSSPWIVGPPIAFVAGMRLLGRFIAQYSGSAKISV